MMTDMPTNAEAADNADNADNADKAFCFDCFIEYDLCNSEACPNCGRCAMDC